MRAASVILGACVAGAGALAWWQGAAEPAPPAAPAGVASRAASGPAAAGAGPARRVSALASPAASAAAVPAAAPLPASSMAMGLPPLGAAPVVPVPAVPPAPLPPEEVAANDALRRLGYHIDERYYRMSLPELRQAAAGQDVQALTHLAERLLFELGGHGPGADAQAGGSQRMAAREALQQAYLLGNRHAAAMLSESYLLERQPVEAAAWNLVARRAGDTLSADWFVRTEDYKRLNDAQRAEAAQRADTLWNQLQAGQAPGS
ncbi:hypothetical protein [Eleftheria terrae]|uniref:hypothetical protein n=1 Tax=Eleftheria terrae TaxID=1597781 RepID=UPI00263B7FEF|nr:hypothetical protein [Eleftheria terrae]WKB51787.1 hypothetical protein N7L95_18565 [Eleftheria terrae]